MSAVETLEMFLAAVRAVAPHAARDAKGVPPGTEVLAWVAREPAKEILERLTDRERADLRHVLDGMRFEREGMT